jgi:DNA repair protein RadC
MDSVMVHPREVFRGALIAGASAIVLMHNHPSGEPQPSEADVKVTRDLNRPKSGAKDMEPIAGKPLRFQA